MVVNGATLGGTGAIAGDVTINAGGIFAPGASIESIGVGSLTIDGAPFAYEVNTATSTLGAAIGDLSYALGNMLRSICSTHPR